MLVIRTFPIFVAGFLFVSAGPTINKRESDDENPPEGPHDMTEHCQSVAEYSGAHYCDAYDICCSPTRQVSALYCTQREYVCVYDNSTKEVTEKKCVISGCFYPTTPPKPNEMTNPSPTEPSNASNLTDLPQSVPAESEKTGNVTEIPQIVTTHLLGENQTSISNATAQNVDLKMKNETAVTQASEVDPSAPSGEVPPEAQARPGVEGTPGNETETAGGDGDAAPGHSLVLIMSIVTILLAVFYQNPVIL